MDCSKKRLGALFVLLVIISLTYMTFVYEVPQQLHRFLLKNGSSNASETQQLEAKGNGKTAQVSGPSKRISNFAARRKFSKGLLLKIAQKSKKRSFKTVRPRSRPAKTHTDGENYVHILHETPKIFFRANTLPVTTSSLQPNTMLSSENWSFRKRKKSSTKQVTSILPSMASELESFEETLKTSKSTLESSSIPKSITNGNLQERTGVTNRPTTSVIDRGESKKRLPNAIIIGSKKGGTRALLNFLGIHPSIQISHKEVHFFDKNYDRGIEWYIDQMPETFRDEITMEKTPGYFVAPSVPKRLSKLCKERSHSMKFLVIVRDPVIRAISDYTQSMHKKNFMDANNKSKKKMKSFESKVFSDVKKKLVRSNQSLISIGLYAHHLKRWLKYFNLKQFHFISGEKLIKKPWKELFYVQKFLNISVSVTKQHFWFNETKQFYCLAEKKKHGTVDNGLHRCFGKTKGRKHPFIKQDTISALQLFFKPFNREFYEMVGRNFGWP